MKETPFLRHAIVIVLFEKQINSKTIILIIIPLTFKAGSFLFLRFFFLYTAIDSLWNRVGKLWFIKRVHLTLELGKKPCRWYSRKMGQMKRPSGTVMGEIQMILFCIKVQCLLTALNLVKLVDNTLTLNRLG